jgi:hypothetical protein
MERPISLSISLSATMLHVTMLVCLLCVCCVSAVSSSLVGQDAAMRGWPVQAGEQ